MSGNPCESWGSQTNKGGALDYSVRFYGLLDHDIEEVIEFYVSKEAAEHEPAEMLADEPGWVRSSRS